MYNAAAPPRYIYIGRSIYGGLPSKNHAHHWCVLTAMCVCRVRVIMVFWGTLVAVTLSVKNMERKGVGRRLERARRW